jgi:predicted porin
MKPALQKLSLIGSLMIAVSTAAIARADGLEKPLFSISGFGTVGAAHSSEKNADYTSSIFKPNGAGYTRDWSFDVDSRLGVQMDVNLTPQLSAVLQVIAEQRYDNSYKPTVEWANAKYQFTPDFSARVGRIALSGFMVSDYGKVGYAIPWVRPPGDLYGLSQLTSSDGIDINYRHRFGALTNTLQSYYGKKDVRTTHNNGSIVEVRNLFGVTNTVDYGAASVRFGYQQGRISMAAISPVFDAFRLFGPRGVEIAERYDLKHKRYQVSAIGASYDPGNWFAMGEYAIQKSDSWLGDRTGWYLSGGYRFNQFTPYLIYSQIKLNSPPSDPGVSTQGMPAASAQVATQLNATLNALLGTLATDQKTIAIGGRWDFAKNAALKVQYDHINMASGSQGTLINAQPGFVRGGNAHVLSVTLDFVF